MARSVPSFLSMKGGLFSRLKLAAAKKKKDKSSSSAAAGAGAKTATTAVVDATSAAAPAAPPPPAPAPATGTVEFFPPAAGAGTMLDASGGLGEPLNVIVSGTSSPAVLTDTGFLNWARSIGFSNEFLGIHIGTPQTANLGDGNGPLPEVKVIRQDYGLPFAGTLLETLFGGNHFRYWRQNGPTANSGALFLAVSHEENVTTSHMIEPDGYDKGRDELVRRAVGKTSFCGVKYSTTSREITGLLPVGAMGINHNIAIDGKVFLLTITIV